jgi:hypothetical protein
MPHWQFKLEKFLQTGIFSVRIYLRANKTFIHNSLYVFDSWGKNLRQKRCSTVTVRKCLITWRAKPIRIIGGPDNQRPDNWSYTVLVVGTTVTRTARNTAFAFVNEIGARTVVHYCCVVCRRCSRIISTKRASSYMKIFIASLTNLTTVLPQSRDFSCTALIAEAPIQAHTTARNLPTCNINLGSLTLPAAETGDFVELILLFGISAKVAKLREKYSDIVMQRMVLLWSH